MASIIAPNAHIEVEFLNSEEGSVWLRSLVKAVKHGDKKAMRAVAVSTVLFFGLGPALHLQDDIGDAFWDMIGHEHGNNDEEDSGFTDEEKKEIVRYVKEAIDRTKIEERRKKMVLAVESDPAIKSIGVSTYKRDDGPISEISRESFPFYGASTPKVRPRVEKTTDHQNRVRVNVIRASLRAGETRPRWRYSSGDGEWSADIEDAEFVWAINADQTGLHLAVGQEMIVDIAIDRRLVDDAWEEENRRIIRVRSPSVKRRQSGFWPDD